MEGILFLIFIGLYLGILIYGSVFLVIGVTYGYWGLSIGMAPVVWILFIIGMIIGFIIAVKNAIKAIRIVYGKDKSR